MAQSDELVALAKSKNVKAIVGVQSHTYPLVLKVKELITSGTIGKILNSTVTASIANMPVQYLESLEYFFNIKSGGNILTIYVGH